MLAGAAAEGPHDQSFGDPRCTEIRGYTGDAMEPYLTRDGRYLLFNSSNAPGVDTDLHVARVVDELTFAYQGPIRGANSPVLDGVPTLDDRGELYFVSVRSYDSTRSTVYRARFADGAASGARLVEGLPRERGVVIFDVDVSPDGDQLYYARGVFTGGPVPRSADLEVAVRQGDRFVLSPARSAALAALNTPSALEYAAAISADGRELFFTRLTGREASIHRAVRATPDAAFDPPARLVAIRGFAEAPTLSPDGQRLYYHQRAKDRFAICRVRRLPAYSATSLEPTRGGSMKRKGHRTIPDFSKKQPINPHGPAPKQKIAPPPVPVRAAKPQATSAKSGQRGR